MKDRLKRLRNRFIINSRYLVNVIRYKNISFDEGVICVIFSRDRALQLEALLRSIETYSLTSFDIIIQYSCSDVHRDSYQELRNRYLQYHFVEEHSFAATLKETIKKIRKRYMFFLVDDQVFIRPFNLNDIIHKMRKKIFFSMRLGACITDFGIYHERLFPKYEKLQEDYLMWKWRENLYQKDWGYQFSVDGTVYRTLDVVRATMSISFKAPNSFEDNMNKVCFFRSDNVGMSYLNPVVINLIINASRQEKAYEHFESGEYTTDDMLKLWERGKSLSVKKIASIPFSSTHYIVDDIGNILCESE